MQIIHFDEKIDEEGANKDLLPLPSREMVYWEFVRCQAATIQKKQLLCILIKIFEIPDQEGKLPPRNKTGFKVEQNTNKWIQDSNPNPNRYKNDWIIFYQKFYFQSNMGLFKSGIKMKGAKTTFKSLNSIITSLVGLVSQVKWMRPSWITNVKVILADLQRTKLMHCGNLIFCPLGVIFPLDPLFD